MTLLCVPYSANCSNGCLKSGASADSGQGQLWGFSFSEPLIAQVTDGIYLGNLCAAYNGQALCKNNIDNIIDMSNMPGGCRLNFIPCTCHRSLSLQEQCFWDINECIEASLEKRKRVLIHCRDGYSLAPTCVIQYLMVKHHMRLIAAYEFVRARYPVIIQECHQDLLVCLERSLWPGEVSSECFKQAMSRKMAWT
uniref:protein-tyrosine-phosphatase n=1 Tax=Salvator merianae TaxID=96440 RepID=A0A8D0C6S9_SALMN